MSFDQALNRLTAISRHWTLKRFLRDDADVYEVTAWSNAKSPGRRVRVQRRDRITAVLAAINELTGAHGKTKNLRLVGGAE